MQTTLEKTAVDLIIDKYEAAWGGGVRDYRLSHINNPSKANLKCGEKFLLIGFLKDWYSLYGRAIYAKRFFPRYQVFAYLICTPLKQESISKIQKRSQKYNEISNAFYIENIQIWIDDYWYNRTLEWESQFF